MNLEVGESPLSALYYPYADVAASQPLLQAALYFDKIYVLEPNFFRPPSRGDDLNRVPHTPDMTDLIGSRVIEPIGPILLGLSSEFGTAPMFEPDRVAEVAGAIRADLDDPRMVALASGTAVAKWSIPTGQQLFWNGLGLLLDYHAEAVTIATDRTAFYSQLLASSGYEAVAVVSNTEFRSRQVGEELQVEVPFLHAESLMLSVTLLACSELGLYPLTDSRLHARFLETKLMRIASEPALVRARELLQEPVSEAMTALCTIEVGLPRLGELTPEKVLSLRATSRDALDRFRAHIRRLRYQVEGNVGTPEFYADLRRVIEVEIEPELAELRHEVTDRARKLAISVPASVVRAAPLPLLVTLGTGIPAAVALAASAGVVAAVEVAEYWTDRTRMQRNGLYFLLEL